MDMNACLETTSSVPLLLFGLCALTLAVVIRRNECLTIKQTWLPMVGRRSIKRTPAINILQALILIVPVGLWAFLYVTCTNG